MPDTIRDLWGDGIQVDDVSPIIILNTQAAILQKRTKGIIVAEVIKDKFDPFTKLSFDIVGQIDRHRSRLLECRYLNADVYPVWVTADPLRLSSADLGPSGFRGSPLPELREPLPAVFDIEPDDQAATKTAHDRGEFDELVSRVFTSHWVRAKISSMIAVANEAKQTLEHLVDRTVTNQPVVQNK